MTTQKNMQLETILSMMSSGYRCIRIERYSLILWGVTGGFLCLFTDVLFTSEKFPGLASRITVRMLFHAVVLSGVAIADFHYLRHRFRAKGESFPFVHAQICKVWWLLLAMGVLFTFGSGCSGNSYMIFGVWLLLVGLGLFMHGLFSEQMLEWAGLMIMLLGICPLMLRVDFDLTKWIAASAFGLGMPALTFMLDGGKARSLPRRLYQSALWLLLVLGPPLAGWWVSLG